MNILKVDPENPNPKIIERAAEILNTGGLVVYPTDTAYGLGGNALDKKVVRKVYEVKGRDFSKPTHVIIRDWKMIENLCYTNSLAKILFDKFLPGPLTMILSKKESVPDILTARLSTVGVRLPNNLVTRSLGKLVPFPYTTPSANKSGAKTPYSIDDVKQELYIEKINLILDAGKLPEVIPSTIIDLTTTPPTILRQGPISRTEIEKIIGQAVL